jgi:hypothetical protein
MRNMLNEKNWVSKIWLVTILMGWEAPKLVVMLEFLNTFVIKGTYIYFGHKDKVYVISKQLIIDVFGVCVEGFIEDLKG